MLFTALRRPEFITDRVSHSVSHTVRSHGSIQEYVRVCKNLQEFAILTSMAACSWSFPSLQAGSLSSMTPMASEPLADSEPLEDSKPLLVTISLPRFWFLISVYFCKKIEKDEVELNGISRFNFILI